MPFYLFKVILCNILLAKSLQIPLPLICNGNRNSDFDKLSFRKKLHWYYFCVFISMVWQIRLKRGAEGSSPIVFWKLLKVALFCSKNDPFFEFFPISSRFSSSVLFNIYANTVFHKKEIAFLTWNFFIFLIL